MNVPARKLIYSLGIPSIFVPGLILAALLGWDWQKDLSRMQMRGGLYQNEKIFPKLGTVVSVVDGDTLELSGGQVVRLIAVQAPERGHPLYGQSNKYLESLALNKNVILEYETVDNMDKYGRLVAYVYLAPNTPAVPTLKVEGFHLQGVMINAQMLKSGLAKFLYYPHYKKYKYFNTLQGAQDEAENKKVGLWRSP